MSLELRTRVLRDESVRGDADYVLYWMTASRRLAWSFALDRALWHAEKLKKPLLIFEPLRVDYRWASVRHHRWILAGMVEHAARLRGDPVGYFPYVEREKGEGRGLLEALARDAAVVVTDDSPVFFTPSLLSAAAERLSCRLEAVDGCGLLPLRAVDRTFTAAYHFRRFLQKTLPDHLVELPSPDPLASASVPSFEGLREAIVDRWPGADDLIADPSGLSDLPIDRSVGVTEAGGGRAAGRTRLDAFLRDGLARYGDERNDPDSGASSGLSPWLHYGHISAHEVFRAVAESEGWSPARLSSRVDGRRAGWWGMSEAAEGFLDELITWREIGFNYCRLEPEYHRYDTLPGWALETLEAHASDPRPWLYDLARFEAAETHDEVWNAAQRQLMSDGVIHNYLRMLWGKKILEWSAHPRDALEIMIELNNKYAIDGRDPNSYTGIMWVLGRFDRGWPERPIYGKVRSMSSDSTRRKVRLDRYLERWGDRGTLELFPDGGATE